MGETESNDSISTKTDQMLPLKWPSGGPILSFVRAGTGLRTEFPVRIWFRFGVLVTAAAKRRPQPKRNETEDKSAPEIQSGGRCR